MSNIFKDVSFVLGELTISTIVGYAVLAWTEPGDTPAHPLKIDSLGVDSGDIAAGQAKEVSGGNLPAQDAISNSIRLRTATKVIYSRAA